MRYFLIQKIQELENFYLKYYKYTIQLIIYQKKFISVSNSWSKDDIIIELVSIFRLFFVANLK